MLHYRKPSAVLTRSAFIGRLLSGGALLLVSLTAPDHTARATSQTPISCDASLKPSDFVDRIDNPYFPLLPGTTFVYEGTFEGLPARNVTQVTNNTKMILGVRTREVSDRLTIDGSLAEVTLDWYAQDRAGNVRYFGEDTKELDKNGTVISTQGSWQAGRNGALPGIVMLARPQTGAIYQQECAAGVAEDKAEVLSVSRSVNVPFGSFHNNVLLTEETTPLDPQSVGQKYYAPGVGLILDIAKKGGRERLDLVSVTH